MPDRQSHHPGARLANARAADRKLRLSRFQRQLLGYRLLRIGIWTLIAPTWLPGIWCTQPVASPGASGWTISPFAAILGFAVGILFSMPLRRRLYAVNKRLADLQLAVAQELAGRHASSGGHAPQAVASAPMVSASGSN